MSWRERQKQMIIELNEKVFSRDPLRVIRETFSSIDVVNSNYIKELKNRENYHSKAFNNWIIEKIKYDFLINQANIDDKIPGYICKFNDGIFTCRLTQELEQTVIGVDNYAPLCRACYNLKMNPEENV